VFVSVGDVRLFVDVDGAKLVPDGRVHTDRVLAMMERLGGKEARDIAERCYASPTAENLEKWIQVCVPLYNQRPVPEEVFARITIRALPADRARFERFPGAGHMLASEEPEAVLAAVREFVLEGSERTAGRSRG
jgi:pimeloyl-ACP methyl ester carboxylesterase